MVLINPVSIAKKYSQRDSSECKIYEGNRFIKCSAFYLFRNSRARIQAHLVSQLKALLWLKKKEKAWLKSKAMDRLILLKMELMPSFSNKMKLLPENQLMFRTKIQTSQILSQWRACKRKLTNVRTNRKLHKSPLASN